EGWWLGRAEEYRPLGRGPTGVRREVQSLEADCSGRDGRNLGADQGSRLERSGGPSSVVFQRQLSMGGDADLRADHWPVVLAHLSIHCATSIGSARRTAGST